MTQQLISTKHFELTRSLDGHVAQALVRFLLLHDWWAGFIEKRQYFSFSYSKIQCMQAMQNIRLLFVFLRFQDWLCVSLACQPVSNLCPIIVPSDMWQAERSVWLCEPRPSVYFKLWSSVAAGTQLFENYSTVNKFEFLEKSGWHTDTTGIRTCTCFLATNNQSWFLKPQCQWSKPSQLMLDSYNVVQWKLSISVYPWEFSDLTFSQPHVDTESIDACSSSDQIHFYSLLYWESFQHLH